MFRLASLLLTFTCMLSGALGEEFPERPIKVVVPFAAGGGSDTFARLIQRAIRDHNLLPHPLVIVNIPGAGGTIGARHILTAKADGYELLFLHDGIVTAKHSGQAKWGPENFAPIAGTGEVGAVITVADDSPFPDLKTLLNNAASSPNTIPFASNIGAPSHFWALLLENAWTGDGDARFRYVQSGGGATRFGALKGGHVSATAFSVAEFLSFREDGLRAVAFLGENHHPALPEVATAREQGVDVVAGNIQGWWAPKGTPSDRIEIVATALRRSMETPELREKLAELQIAPVFLTGDQLAHNLATRESQIAAAGTRALPPLPNLAWVFGGIAMIAGVGAAMRRPVREKSPPTLSILLPLFVIAYAAALAASGDQFLWATPIFVIAAVGYLTHWKAQSLAKATALGLSLAFGLHWLFGTVLTVQLP